MNDSTNAALSSGLRVSDRHQCGAPCGSVQQWEQSAGIEHDPAGFAARGETAALKHVRRGQHRQLIPA